MKKTTTIRAHHGSPGGPQDFQQLREFLEGYQLSTPDRYGDQNNNLTNESNFEVGYSWGCAEALSEAVQNTDRTKGVILIAPFLFPKKKMSGLKKSVLGLPLVGKMILGKAADSAIDQMLNDSSSPSQVPSFYQQQKSYLANPERLKKALFEKENKENEIMANIKKLKALGTPVFIIRGDEDLSSDSTQSGRLKNILEVEEEIVKNSGHALPYTHAKQVGELLKRYLDRLNSSTEEKHNTEKPFGYQKGEHQLNNVSSFLSKHAAEIPNHPILSWVDREQLQNWSFDLNQPLPHKSVTVAELDHLVSVIAAGMKKLGIQKGDRAIVFVPMSLPMYAAMFALQKIGAVAVFLDSWARRDQMGSAAEVVDAKVIISVDMAFKHFKGVEQIDRIPMKISVGPATEKYTASVEELMAGTEKVEATAVEQEHTALITFTTGSSGTPKGADRTHRFLAAQHYALDRHLPYQESDRDLPVFPIFSLNNLAAGVTTILPAIDVGTPSEKDAIILLAQMKSAEVSCTTLSPSLLRVVSSYCIENKIKLPFLKRIITGGAPVSRDDLIEMTSVAENAEVLVLYGSTEVEPMAHIEAKEMIAQKSSEDSEIVDEGVLVGKFDSGLNVKYLKINKDSIVIKSKNDWVDLEVEKGNVGEIIVSGEHVCENYFNNSEAFARAKIKDENGVIWHRTGDLGRVDSSGNLWLVGRVHNAINRNNLYCFPVRSEIVLKKLPFVDLCAYLGVEDSELGEKTVVAYTTKEENPSSEKILENQKEISRIMEKNSIPVDKIVFTDSIPMDARHHSKVEYSVLRNQLREKGLL
ncbi:MAG: AMP-binding protein [Halobacteriovoraceae bacterium]|jgi:olefin beta-lactone synthetase|nr:AMP-binding protein [Halobacteriovoraceae bacterium]MBT5092804.1 AMP-binding protein [Halobacteriovoraceae bacterium]